MIETEVLDRINYFLNFKHWTLYRLAKESDIPYSSLNNVFLRNTCPTIPTLEKICAGLGISLSEFFSFCENPLHSDKLTAREEELLNAYRQLSVQDKALIEAYLDGLCKTLKRQKDSIHEETNEKQKKTKGRPKQKKQI